MLTASNTSKTAKIIKGDTTYQHQATYNGPAYCIEPAGRSGHRPVGPPTADRTEEDRRGEIKADTKTLERKRYGRGGSRTRYLS